MDGGVVRNSREAKALSEFIMNRRKPFKWATQDIYPKRSLDSNRYYWGIVLKLIAEHSGHSQVECHESYKQMFNFRYDIRQDPTTKQWTWVMEVSSTAKLDEKEIWDYIMKVRIDGELQHHIIIPMPNECFVPELNLSKNE
jgi:hypothetical protein